MTITCSSTSPMIGTLPLASETHSPVRKFSSSSTMLSKVVVSSCDNTEKLITVRDEAMKQFLAAAWVLLNFHGWRITADASIQQFFHPTSRPEHRLTFKGPKQARVLCKVCSKSCKCASNACSSLKYVVDTDAFAEGVMHARGNIGHRSDEPSATTTSLASGVRQGGVRAHDDQAITRPPRVGVVR